MGYYLPSLRDSAPFAPFVHPKLPLAGAGARPPIGTLPGSAPVPVAVSGLAPKTVAQTEWFHVLPHPGLLPKEKEERAPSSRKTRDWIGRTINRKIKTRQGDSFSPGEKARMRASVKTNFRSSSFVVRPPQTAIGRAAGTWLGRAPGPVAVFAVAPQTVSKAGRVFADGHPNLSKILHVQAAAFNDAFERAEGNGFAAVHGHNHLPAILVPPFLVAAGLRD